MEEWLTLTEAAAYLQVHPKTVYRYVKAGRLRQFRRAGIGRPRFRREDLEALLHGEEQDGGRQEESSGRQISEVSPSESQSPPLAPTRSRGFRFGAPDLSDSESNSVARAETLREVLQEIDDISRRLEELRRVVEELLKSEERVR
jgi:excisionase family DNA binding protein